MTVTCEIRGCSRYTGKYDASTTRWICGKHWMRLTKAERRVFARLRRIARKNDSWEAVGLARVNRIWRSIKTRVQDHGL